MLVTSAQLLSPTTAAVDKNFRSFYAMKRCSHFATDTMISNGQPALSPVSSHTSCSSAPPSPSVRQAAADEYLPSGTREQISAASQPSCTPRDSDAKFSETGLQKMLLLFKRHQDQMAATVTDKVREQGEIACKVGTQFGLHHHQKVVDNSVDSNTSTDDSSLLSLSSTPSSADSSGLQTPTTGQQRHPTHHSSAFSRCCLPPISPALAPSPTISASRRKRQRQTAADDLLDHEMPHIIFTDHKRLTLLQAEAEAQIESSEEDGGNLLDTTGWSMNSSSFSSSGGSSVATANTSTSSSNSSETPMSRTNQYKKVMKPLLERKRRARINKCLDELKDIMTGALQAEGENVAKLEKADILELTVGHLHRLRANKQLNWTLRGQTDRSSELDDRLPSVDLSSTSAHDSSYELGYSMCARDTAAYLMSMQSDENLASDGLILGRKMMRHLTEQITAPALRAYGQLRRPSCAVKAGLRQNVDSVSVPHSTLCVRRATKNGQNADEQDVYVDVTDERDEMNNDIDNNNSTDNLAEPAEIDVDDIGRMCPAVAMDKAMWRPF